MVKYILLIFSVVWCGCSSNEVQEENQQNAQEAYSEKYRPQFHFSPEEKWMNDPNGMVYYEGEYHLFYQYYPDSTVWGPMHWGHAVSTDLISWEHLPIALYPDELGYIFSGSAVIDTANTSGLGTTDNPAMVAIYTYHNAEAEKSGAIDYQTQAIAYSLDKGRNWIKYDKNPVLSNPGIKDFRDPKVRWHSPSEKWIMTLAVLDHISFYSSPNLIDWTFESDFGVSNGDHGGVWECPDLFPLNYNNNTYWALLVSINPGAPNGGSGTQYFIGDFDGKIFTTQQTDTLWLDYGTDNYAGVTWANEPEDRTLFLGWMGNWDYAQIVPTENWRSAMTLPRELSIFADNQDLKLKSKPIDNLQSLRSGLLVNENVVLKMNQALSIDNTLIEISGKIQHNGADTVTIQLSNDNQEAIFIHISAESNQVSIDRSQSKALSFSDAFGKVQKAPFDYDNYTFKIFKDESSIEIFFNDGELVMTALYFTEKPLDSLSINSLGNATITENEIYKLKTIWNE